MYLCLIYPISDRQSLENRSCVIATTLIYDKSIRNWSSLKQGLNFKQCLNNSYDINHRSPRELQGNKCTPDSICGHNLFKQWPMILSVDYFQFLYICYSLWRFLIYTAPHLCEIKYFIQRIWRFFFIFVFHNWFCRPCVDNLIYHDCMDLL